MQIFFFFFTPHCNRSFIYPATTREDRPFEFWIFTWTYLTQHLNPGLNPISRIIDGVRLRTIPIYSLTDLCYDLLSTLGTDVLWHPAHFFWPWNSPTAIYLRSYAPYGYILCIQRGFLFSTKYFSLKPSKFCPWHKFPDCIPKWWYYTGVAQKMEKGILSMVSEFLMIIQFSEFGILPRVFRYLISRPNDLSYFFFFFFHKYIEEEIFSIREKLLQE